MSNAVNEKRELEKHACGYFLEYYNRLKKTNFKIIEYADKPDLVVKDSISDDIIGIEVGHLYYDSDEAKMLFGRSNKKRHGIMNSSGLIASLNTLLRKKSSCSENYNFNNRMFLIIRVASPIFDKSIFDLHEKDITIHFNIFSEIWLICKDSSKQEWDGLKRLK